MDWSMPLPTLSIDTATEVLALALGEGDRILAKSSIDAGRSHLELLLPGVQSLLEGAGFTVRDIDAIVAGTGPGTFSGLRVGIATARALAQSLEIRLSGFSTLEALALGLAGVSPAELVLPIIDAKRSQVFARLYKKEGKNTVRAESDVLCLDPRELLEELAKITGGKVGAAGNGVLAYRDIFVSAGQLEPLEPDHPGNRVDACWHLRADRAEASAVYNPGRLLSVVPQYVREPDADKTILLRKKEPWLQ
ncbi:MAG: tRNA (adenosine(37)-N6)-threonylcarbamoyltransferase complex dimerization subunit type 1 TsaB [Thermoleophilia bacterium]